MKTSMIALTLALLSFYSLRATAGNTTSTFSPNVSVSNVCVIQSSSNLSFGNYIPNSLAPLETTGQVKIACTKGATVTVLPVSGGSTMSGGGTTLKYGLYSDSGFTAIFGAGVPTYSTYDFTSSTGVSFNTQTTTTLANCQTLSGGLTFAYWSSQSWCLTSLASTTTTLRIDDPYGPATGGGMSMNGLAYINGATIKASWAWAWMLYIPQASTLVSGHTYNVLTSTNGGSQPLTGTATSVKTPLVLPYYGKVPAQQDVPPGAYVDTVTLQVSF